MSKIHVITFPLEMKKSFGLLLMVSAENHTPSQMDAPNSGLVAFTWSGDELCGSSTTTRLLGGKAPLRRCLYCIFMH